MSDQSGGSTNGPLSWQTVPNLSVAQAVDALEAELRRRDFTVFARIDHSGAAHSAGLELADEQVVIFGDPSAGTALMQDNPSIGIELPLRMLIWSVDQQTRAGFRRPSGLLSTYELKEADPLLKRMDALLEELVDLLAGIPPV